MYTENCCPPVISVPLRGIDLKIDAAALGGNGGASTNYSYEEQWTGRLWVNGKKIYQKTLEFGTLPNSTTKKVPHIIESIDRFINIEGFAYTAKNDWMHIPHAHCLYLQHNILLYLSNQNIEIITNYDQTPWTAVFTLLYTCTDR